MWEYRMETENVYMKRHLIDIHQQQLKRKPPYFFSWGVTGVFGSTALLYILC